VLRSLKPRVTQNILATDGARKIEFTHKIYPYARTSINVVRCPEHKMRRTGVLTLNCSGNLNSLTIWKSNQSTLFVPRKTFGDTPPTSCRQSPGSDSAAIWSPTRETSTKPSDHLSAARVFSACQPAVLKSLFQPRMTRRKAAWLPRRYTRINTDSENEFQPSALISGRARHFRRRLAMAGQAVRAAPAPDFTAS